MRERGFELSEKESNFFTLKLKQSQSMEEGGRGGYVKEGITIAATKR